MGLGDGWVTGGEGAESAELDEPVDTRHEKAGVDRASNGWRRGDGGDDRHAEDIAYVTGVQGPPRLRHQDHAIEVDTGGRQ
jgi:hypothetical protein